MRVLHVIETGGPGGAERVFVDLVTHVDGGRFPPTVALLRGGDWVERALREGAISPTLLRSGGRPDLSLLRSLIGVIHANRIDLVHSHLMDMNFYASLAGRAAGVPVIATEHGDIHHPSKKGKIRGIKPKVISRLAAAWVTVSRFTRSELIRRYSVREEKVRVIYNGIPEPPSPEPLRRRDLGLPEDAFLVGCVGNLYPVKGHRDVIEALPRLLREVPTAHLLIAGRGSEEGALRARAAELRVEDHLHLLGLREDVPALLGLLDVFLLPSLSEGLPLSLLEAMGAGLPSVASAVGGVPEVIEDGKDGLLFPAGDGAGLCGHLLHLARSGEERDRLGRAARATFRERFTLGRMVREYEALYERFG